MIEHEFIPKELPAVMRLDAEHPTCNDRNAGVKGQA